MWALIKRASTTTAGKSPVDLPHSDPLGALSLTVVNPRHSERSASGVEELVMGLSVGKQGFDFVLPKSTGATALSLT